MASKHSVILVPVDFSEASEHALVRALEFAERLGSKIQLLFVAPPLQPLLPRFAPNVKAVAEIAKQETDEARRELTKLQERSEVIARTEVVEGVPHEQIVAYADQVDAELIVMGTTGHSRLGSVVLGSTTERVLHKSSRPVIVVPWKKGT